MSEVAPADRSRLLQLKRAKCSAIVSSRKRKLRQLFAVATEVDVLPNNSFHNPDAPPTTRAETQFLQDCDILKGRKLNELNIPPRPKRRLDALQKPQGSPGLTREFGVRQKGGQDAGKHSPTSLSPATINRGPHTPIRKVDDSEASIPNAQSSPSSDAIPSRLPPSTGDVVAENADVQPRASPRDQSPRHLSPSRSPAEYVAGKRNDREVTELPVYSHSNGPAVNLLGTTPRSVSPQQTANVRSAIPDTVGTVSTDLSESQVEDRNGQVETNNGEARDQAHVDAISKPAPPDTSRLADVLSSPGSTAQTATTPAVQVESTDTSPDHDGPHYIDAEEGESTRGKEVDDRGGSPDNEREHDGALASLNGDQAQLLQESVAAQLSRAGATGTPNGSKDPVADEHDEPCSESQTVTLSDPQPREPVDSAGAALDDVEVVQAPSPKVEPDRDTRKSPAPEIRDSQEESAEPMEINGISAVKHSEPATQTQVEGDIGPVQAPSAEEPKGSSSAEGARFQEQVDENLQSPRSEVLEPATNAGHVFSKPSGQAGHATASLTPASTQLDKQRRRKALKAKPPTVIFGKRRKESHEVAVVTNRAKPGQIPTDDYFLPLFVQGFTQQQNRMKPIEALLHHAHKAVSTHDSYLSILDSQACRVLRRVYHLQQQDKWSLRQPKRCAEPTRPPSHWDVLLQEMKWMRTDFREERKWKMAVARNLAHACSEWVQAGSEERKLLQVNAIVPSHPVNPPHVATVVEIGSEGASDVAPESIPSFAVGTPRDVDEEPSESLIQTIAPSAIFAMQDDDVVFNLHQSPTADQLLAELPLYGAPLKVPDADVTGPDYDPDAHWRKSAVPISKYIEGKMVLSTRQAPRKRSRFEYENEDSEDDEEVFVGTQLNQTPKTGPQTSDVALFNPEMKPIRDRLYASHQFRPPTEHPMPQQSFYETRSASQWTLAEDDELKTLVRQFSYNWSLISNIISSNSSFTSGAERRTPWECFERWVHQEGLPSDMSKTQYFKTYQNRIDAAQRNILQQSQNAQPQQAGPNGAVASASRRRQTTTVRVERRRNQKHLALIDAMRKLAKKRETTLQKQQHSASMAAMRKENQVQPQRGPVKTPRDYSLMRWERDQQLAEKMAQFAQRQQEANRRGLIPRAPGQAVQLGASGAGQGSQNAAQLGSANALAGVARVNASGQLPVQGPTRPRISMQGGPSHMANVQAHLANGGLVPAMQINGIPQAQMQGLQVPHRMSIPNQPDINLMLQARRISEQQRQAVQQIQQQQHQQGHQQHTQQHTQQQPQHQAQQIPQGSAGAQNSPAPMRNNVNGVNQQNFMNNSQAMIAAFHAANGTNGANGTGMVTPPASGLNMPPVSAGSPRGHGIQASQLNPHILASLREMENTIRSKNPSLTPEQASRVAHDQVARMLMQRTQSAMNAAAGGGSGGGGVGVGSATGSAGSGSGGAQQAMANGLSVTTSPHQYAQLLRAQQQAQQAAAAAAGQSNGHAQHQRSSSNGAQTPSLGK